MTRPVYRFAPSPNGLLHLGHALSALLNDAAARAARGRLLLRMEDIDTTRCTPAFEAAIRADLAWLGITFDGPVRRQSEHFDEYHEAVELLRNRGLVYRAWLTRGEIRKAVADHEASRGTPWPRDPDGAPLYPGDLAVLGQAEIDRREEEGAPFALRLDMARACAAARISTRQPLTFTETDTDGRETRVTCDPAAWGDVVIARKDVPTSYHLAVTLDDARQGVTHVLRGRDLFAATDVHRLLQVLLGLPEPVYRHHRLIPGPDGRKLSKSNGDTALCALREAGATPAEIRTMVGLG
uniref:tRNA glutamyl-Q(34) synthetase GluQRS n=1 Tax=Stappia sp. TaxID=1870903 RepID=UPI003BA9F6F7